MRKLIAKRPVQYMGRIYEPGDALPAQDGRMVEAWTRAETAVWADTTAATAAQDAGLESEGWKVINALLDMGVILEDENGAFVGEEKLIDQLLVAPTAAMEAADALNAMGINIYDNAGNFVGPGDLEKQIKNMVKGGQEPPATPQEGGDGHQDPQGETGAPAGQENGKEPEMVTGHLDAEDLAKMKKADLEDLAAKLGVDISKAKNNDERAALIAAVEIQAPAQETGGAQ